MFTPLQTERLTLRLHAPGDAPALVRLAGTREVAATTLRIPHPYSEAEAEKFIRSTHEDLASGTAVNLAVVVRESVLRESGELCGGVGLRIEPEHRHAEIGYWIGPPYWGNGYATEAAAALLDYGFATLGLHRIFASLFTRNRASAGVLKKIGMRYEGVMRGHILKWGVFEDLDTYAMLATDRPQP